MTNAFPSRAVQDVAFCPFDDVLGVGHAAGFTSLIIPGAGEANFDSTEADPFENKRARQEREVNALLDKIQPDQITYDRDLIGKVARPVKGGVLGAGGAGARPKGIGPRQDITPFSKLSRTDKLAAKQQDQSSVAVDLRPVTVDEDGTEMPIAVPAAEKKEDGNKRVKGRGKVRKRVARSRANIVTAQAVALKDKIAEKKAQAAARRADAAKSTTDAPKSALDRFGRP